MNALFVYPNCAHPLKAKCHPSLLQEAFPDQPPTGAFSQQLTHFLSRHSIFGTNNNDDDDDSELTEHLERVHHLYT